MSTVFNIRITRKCNRRCEYCTIKKFEGEAEFDAVSRIIDYLIEKKVPDIGIYGGEVLLHSRIDDILKKYPHRLNILTNGDYIDDPRMKMFKNIIISIHDKLSVGVFDKFECRELHIAKYLLVLTHKNFKNIMKVYKKLDDSIKDRIYFIPYKNIMFDDMYLTSEDKEFINKVNKNKSILESIPIDQCLTQVRVSNIDCMTNSMAYCCMSHYRIPLTLENINHAIKNSIDNLDIEKQINDCKLCTKRWERSNDE